MSGIDFTPHVQDDGCHMNRREVLPTGIFYKGFMDQTKTEERSHNEVPVSGHPVQSPRSYRGRDLVPQRDWQQASVRVDQNPLGDSTVARSIFQGISRILVKVQKEINLNLNPSRFPQPVPSSFTAIIPKS